MRFKALFTGCLAVVLCGAGCFPEDPVQHHKFGMKSRFKNQVPVPAAALAALKGMFKVESGQDRFGRDVAVHTTSKTLSLFSGVHGEAFATLNPGCVDDGQTLLLEGQWRYFNSSSTGLMRLTVGPPALAAELCAGAAITPEMIQQTPPTLEGGTGRGPADPTAEVFKLSFMRPLRDQVNFKIAANHGACRTTDDCGASENSLETIRLVESFGAQILEVDVRLTADGVPILYHDDNFNPRLVNGPFCRGSVQSFTMQDIRALCRLKFGEQVPTLEEGILTVINETDLATMWLDLKSAAAVGPADAVVRKLTPVIEAAPRSLEVLLGLPDSSTILAYEATATPRMPCLVEDLPSDVERLGCLGWGPQWTAGPTLDDVKALQAKDYFVSFWTLNDEQFITRALKDVRPNSIVTNRPGLVFYLFQTLQFEHAMGHAPGPKPSVPR